MFTGIVESVGTIVAVVPLQDGRRITVGAPAIARELALGDSVAVDGVCLTVTASSEERFDVEAIGTTLSRTTVGDFVAGRPVNLERALAFGARLGGHLVQGHVDGVGRVLSIRRAGEHVLLDVTLPEVVAEVTVLHGSIAINGVSLTVNALPQKDVAQVALIPFTWQHTNLRELAEGHPVNLEGDMIGRFVVGYLERRGA
jgi:riboflavin synthase